MGQRCRPQFVNESVRQERERGIEVSGTNAVEELEHELDLRGVEVLLRRACHGLITSMGGWGADLGGRVLAYMQENRGV